MLFESILKWQRLTLEKAAAEQKTDTTDFLIELLLEWADDEYWNYLDIKAKQYNYILKEQEE